MGNKQLEQFYQHAQNTTHKIQEIAVKMEVHGAHALYETRWMQIGKWSKILEGTTSMLRFHPALAPTPAQDALIFP